MSNLTIRTTGPPDKGREGKRTERTSHGLEKRRRWRRASDWWKAVNTAPGDCSSWLTTRVHKTKCYQYHTCVTDRTSQNDLEILADLRVGVSILWGGVTTLCRDVLRWSLFLGDVGFSSLWYHRTAFTITTAAWILRRVTQRYESPHPSTLDGTFRLLVRTGLYSNIAT